MTFTKTGTPTEIAFEVAGLADLAEAGSTVAEIVSVDDTHLVTVRITDTAPSPTSARALGRMLAAQHRVGADRPWGAAPPAFDLERFGGGAMGRAGLPLTPLTSARTRSWGEFYGSDRLLPYLGQARDNGAIDAEGARIIERLAGVLADGRYDTGDDPSVLHGDLWSGNVMWGEGGPVLIDPASHTGHRESDLAQLSVFGVPHLDQILAGYQEVFPLADGWDERVGLHQLHILIVHAALFGSGYGTQTVSTARRYL